MQQVFDHPQVRHRGMLRPVQHPSYGELPQLGPAAKYSAFDVEQDWTAPPLLGEHTEEVLREWLALRPSEIARLKAQKVI
jgi:crotonobetainyl-CoA:carnitine CoA-transferase CaiB-like acyl-CoA transferase